MRDGQLSSVACAPFGGRGPQRLTKRAEFLAVAAGRRFHTGRMTVQGLVREAGSACDPQAVDESSSAPGLRVGLTVTKRVGHATERNRIRRRLRAAIAQAAVPHADAPLDVVLVGRRDALSAAFPQLVADLSRALPAVAKGKPDQSSGAARLPRSAKSEQPSRDPAAIARRR
jgi:ribonuclease P protein component